jgi:hypothetical protein
VSKQDKADRRQAIDQIRKKQASAEKRRGYMIVVVCAVLGLLIIGAAAWKPLKDKWDAREFADLQVSEIGAPADVCQDVTTKKANGTQDHVEPGTPLDYPEAPPAFGRHYNIWADFETKFSTVGDRPELGELVHNLEHGYTILWYDETAADDAEQMDQIRAIADKFTGSSNLRTKFKAVPWTSEDGEPFPDGQHIALTHWSAGGAGTTDPSEQVGVWQYCSAPSGAALEEFMEAYPYTDSPEPAGG